MIHDQERAEDLRQARIREARIDCIKRWTEKASKALLGRTIVEVRYLTDIEQKDLGWYESTLVIGLDDGTYFWPSRDDEGNDAGSLFTTNESIPVIPVIP